MRLLCHLASSDVRFRSANVRPGPCFESKSLQRARNSVASALAPGQAHFVVLKAHSQLLITFTVALSGLSVKAVHKGRRRLSPTVLLSRSLNSGSNAKGHELTRTRPTCGDAPAQERHFWRPTDASKQHCYFDCLPAPRLHLRNMCVRTRRLRIHVCDESSRVLPNLRLLHILGLTTCTGVQTS